MTNIFPLIIFSILLVTFTSCKSKKNATATSPSNTATQSTNASINNYSSITPPKEEGTIRFIVSFYSIGQGIDGNLNDKFVKFLDSYTKNISYAPTHWGREGEIDYCLALKELSSPEQTEFIKKATALLAGSKLVHLKENAVCTHTGWPSIDPPQEQQDENYRLVVSFYSEGEGTDLKVKEEFEKFLNTFPKKVAFEPTRWGREGEVDYCLKLNELSSTEQIDFVKKAKELLIKSKLVHVNENTKCVHKR